MHKGEILAYFQAHPRVQQFVAAEDGAANCFHMVAALDREAREAGAHQGREGGPQCRPCFLAWDVKNAFNTLSRRAIWRLFDKHYLSVER